MLNILILFICLLSPAYAAGAVDPQAHPAVVPGLSPVERIDGLVESAIRKGLISGGVVHVGSRDGLLFEKSYGRIAPEPTARPVTTDTIFDLASLTKVVATTTAVMKLAEEGKLSLVDPALRWFPEMEGKGKDDLLLLNLLTHTSGLDDFSFDPAAPLQSAVLGAAGQKLKGDLGSRFHYADINFILLAEVVKRVSGESLDVYAAKRFYAPLGMKDTGFHPPGEKYGRIAPTFGDGSSVMIGLPQDYPCRQLGGVAGHAGLFSTAGDLALFCRMILGDGMLGGKRVLEERTVRQMTAPYFSRGGRVIRGLGWDIASPYSTPRGGFFSRSSFGHTGYSGTSLWIDGDAGIFVILLTSRLDYRKKGEFNQFRGDLSTLAAEAFGRPVSLGELEEAEGGAL
ncbi:MAG TPA: serine hydrolase domain-containing protein [Geobacteraceae bacterium]|nr:serine hydrolase domain-containing protein [Geobacteraceae bacterium]